MSKNLDRALSTLDRALGDEPEPLSEQWLNIYPTDEGMPPNTRAEADERAAAAATVVGSTRQAIVHVMPDGTVELIDLR